MDRAEEDLSRGQRARLVTQPGSKRERRRELAGGGRRLKERKGEMRKPETPTGPGPAVLAGQTACLAKKCSRTSCRALRAGSLTSADRLGSHRKLASPEVTGADRYFGKINLSVAQRNAGWWRDGSRVR